MLQFPSISIFPSDRNAFRLIPVHANNAINETIDETIENDLHGHKSTPAATVSIELDYHRSSRCFAHAVKFNRDTIGNGLFENNLGIPSGLFACLVIARSPLLVTCFVFGWVFLFLLVIKKLFFILLKQSGFSIQKVQKTIFEPNKETKIHQQVQISIVFKYISQDTFPDHQWVFR